MLKTKTVTSPSPPRKKKIEIQGFFFQWLFLRAVFHLPKDSRIFRKLRWEMFIGEGRVPFDTLVPFISRLPSPSDENLFDFPGLRKS